MFTTAFCDSNYLRAPLTATSEGGRQRLEEALDRTVYRDRRTVVTAKKPTIQKLLWGTVILATVGLVSLRALNMPVNESARSVLTFSRDNTTLIYKAVDNMLARYLNINGVMYDLNKPLETGYLCITEFICRRGI